MPSAPDRPDDPAPRPAPDGWTQSIFGAGAVPMGWSLGLLTGVLLAQIFLGPLREQAEGADLARYRQVRDFAREAYVREVSDRELLDAALTGMMAGLDDYSRYYDESGSVALDRETSGRFESVGAVFRHMGGAWRALFPTPGGPAGRAGLQVGDRIDAVDGTVVAGLDGDALRALLVDEDASPVTLSVTHRDGTSEDLRVTPARLVDPSVRHVRLLDADAGIGYVSIQSFSQETDEEFDRAVAWLEERGARSLVVDLRGNLGGVLDAAVRVAQRFVPEGVIVSTEGRGAPKIDRADADRATLTDLEVVLLVDRLSASASEVLAACLQDHRAATLVGSRTYGKGVVQSIRRFANPDARAKVTSAYYYSPARRNVERSADRRREPGLVPDVLVELEHDALVDAHQFLAAYAPPADLLPAIEAWEADDGVSILEPLPRDAQVATALDLLGGK